MRVEPEIRRRMRQRETLLKILTELELEPDPVREDRVRASLFETERRIEDLRQAPRRRVAELERELERARREAEEADRG